MIHHHLHFIYVYFFLYHFSPLYLYFFFFFNDTATTEIYTLSLHDALPISRARHRQCHQCRPEHHRRHLQANERSEEHTSELQSRQYLVCRLLLEKKKKKTYHKGSTLTHIDMRRYSDVS